MSAERSLADSSERDLLQPVRGARLEVHSLTKAFYGVLALSDVDFVVEPSEIVGLIGPNGSGKTTALDCIAGLQKRTAGHTAIDGHATEGLSPHQVARMGVGRTFQSVRVFGTLTARRNLQVAGLLHESPWAQFRGFLRRLDRWPELDERVDQVIGMLNLSEVADQRASELSYGQKKLLEFGTAMVRPLRILLLDEPIAAVNPTLANVIREWIKRLRLMGTSILLVEHNIELVIELCDRVVVLDHGQKIADGAPRFVMTDPAVQEAYFGR